MECIGDLFHPLHHCPVYTLKVVLPKIGHQKSECYHFSFPKTEIEKKINKKTRYL